MSIQQRIFGFFLGLCILTGSAAAQVSLSLGPFSHETDVNGVPVTITTRVQLDAKREGSSGAVTARVVSDLADLQAKIGSIVATLPLPRDNCASYKPDNFVASISQSSLSPVGNSAVFALHGTIEVWACVEIPLFDPVKTEIGSQSFNASIPFQLQVGSDQSISIVPGRPEIDLTGQYASITEGVLSIADVDISALAYDALMAAIDPNDLRGCLPEELKSLQPTVQEARFVEENGRLAVEMRMTATLTLPALATLAASARSLAQADFGCA